MAIAAHFLENLNDVEFAFLYRCKRDTYMDAGRQLLEQERIRRGLTPEQLQAHVSATEYQLTNTGCVRCNSPRPLISNQCTVCGHVLRPNTHVPCDNESRHATGQRVLAVLGDVAWTLLDGIADAI